MLQFIRWSTRLLTVAFVACLFATVADIHGATKPKVTPKTVYIAVVSVDSAAMTITVEPKNSMSTDTHTYKVTPATVVKVNGNPAMLADLKPDMMVHFELAADGTTATELSASPAPRE